MVGRNILNILYNKQQSPLEFNFDSLTAPPLLSLLTIQDITELNKIATSIKLNGKIDLKYKLIDQIMTNRGFVKLHAGTNRVVYRFLEDQRFVVKIAVDRVGLGDNPAEYKNQFLLKPFVTKIFEVSPCGTVALVERVDAILSREEFLSVADDIFNLITKFFVGKYILEDFGTHYFMNWGIRNSISPVLLDFPYVYELDGNKLYCNASTLYNRNIPCGGQLDYDDGFNNLICTRCGKHYHARDLKKSEENKLIIIGGKKKLKVKVLFGTRVMKDNTHEVIKSIPIKPEIELEDVVAPSVTEPVVDEEPVVAEEVKVEEVKEEPKVIKKIPYEKPKTTNNSVKENKDMDMVTKLDNALNEIDDYEDEYEEYNQYLSNRQRSGKKNNTKMKPKRGNNVDFSGF